MNQLQPQQIQIVDHKPADKYDRAMGALVGVPDVLHTPPATVRAVSPLVGTVQTFVIQSFRSRDGERSEDHLFIEYIDESRNTRIYIPPNVCRVIYRQYDALTGRARKRGAKAATETRRARGIEPAFLRGKKRKSKATPAA